MVGDQVLIQVARRLESAVRYSDTVARMGGDEFIILLPDLAREEDAATVAENILQQLAKPYDVEGNRLQLTASIGVTLSDGSIADPVQLIQQADLAMYRAKQGGRNDYQWYTENLNQNLFDRLKLRADLQRAIENSEFELYYQPQVQASALELAGMEALLRWHHPERGMVPPDEFIPMAEGTGQIVVLSEWVLRTACQDARRLQLSSQTERTVAVNVSPLHFQKSGFVKTVQRILTETGLEPRFLELEVTEGLLLDNTEQAIDTLAELRALGISIAIDDFGTGYSSLSYLKRLPVDKIKIDKAFIRDLMADTRDAAIVDSIITMAHNLGMEVVAEGVETEAQHQFLLEHGCDSFQGFFFARPMPFERFTVWLAQQL
jgi:predicted signal transduction protein with EAL and GGDEF domain